jgi:uncharacterized protein (TIGR02271 family)
MPDERTVDETDERRAALSERQTGTIPLIEETLRVGKREVTTGRVRIRSVTDAVTENARTTLDEEKVEVTRVPVGREVETAPAVRTDGDVVIVPILEEVLVVEKRLVLKEELHIRRQVNHEDVEVPVTLRKQRAVIERLGPDGEPLRDQSHPIQDKT